MSRTLNRYPYLLVVLSGLATGGIYSFGLPALFLPVLVLPFFWLFIQPDEVLSFKKSLVLSACFFFAFYSTTFIWFLDTDVSLLAGLDPNMGPIILGFGLLLISTILTLISLPFGIMLFKLQAQIKQPNLIALVLLASAWCVMEWARSLTFALFLSAPQASIGDYWNFGSLGLGLTSTSVGYLSRVVGMYGLSFIAVSLTLSLGWAINKRYKPLALIVSVVVIASFLSYTVINNGDKALVSASLLQREGQLTDIQDSIPINFNSNSPKDFILLPEYSGVHLPGNEKFVEKYVTGRMKATGINIDVTADFIKPGKRFNTLEARNKNGKLVDSQTKELLIPTGEYLPSVIQSFYKLTGQDAINKSFAQTRRLDRGQPPRVIRTQAVSIAPVACSGILGRNIYRQLVNDGGEVLTNSASLLIFNNSKSYLRQSSQMAHFHAVANNRTYIQASMGAPAFVIDGNGHYTVAPDDTRTEFIDFNFTPNSQKTPYTKYGEWPLTLSGLILAAYMLAGLKNKLKPRRST
ncbi:MAG: hypothetical protein QFB86_04180 [Patescibacteria group bacterium]|nr:hypothetical protein [Patescibacteria group bacterium]